MNLLKVLFHRPFSALNKKLVVAFLVTSLVGLIDSLYLTVEHYTGGKITCTIIHGCQQVLTSPYSSIWGIPLALMGAVYYLLIFITSIAYLDTPSKYAAKILAYIPLPAWIFSLWLLYVQAALIKNFCQFCLLSLLTSTILFFLSLKVIKQIPK